MEHASGKLALPRSGGVRRADSPAVRSTVALQPYRIALWAALARDAAGQPFRSNAQGPLRRGRLRAKVRGRAQGATGATRRQE